MCLGWFKSKPHSSSSEAQPVNTKTSDTKPNIMSNALQDSPWPSQGTQSQVQSQSTPQYNLPSSVPASNNPFAAYMSPAPPPPNPPPADYTAPPPNPPPPVEPVHNWQTAVPDTSLLPPPPSLGNQSSSTNNATEAEAEQGKAWCDQNPLTEPYALPQPALDAIETGTLAIIYPRGFVGDLNPLAPGIWQGKSKANSPDTCITSAVPLYSAPAHSPLHTGKAKTIYYEVAIAPRNRSEVSLALGFAAPPYPTFRLPGWHRGSLAVHGDDGSKFINDMWGGKAFTAPFRPGERIGLGMTFTPRDGNAPPAYGSAAPAGEIVQTTSTTPINVEIFLTRDGQRTGGWNLHEEGDAEEDLPVVGLEGHHDLLAAIGSFDKVEFEIIFERGRWLYTPPQ